MGNQHTLSHCLGSERDDSVDASCRREQWSAGLHIDFRAVRGALVPSLTPSRARSTSSVGFSLMHASFFFWLSHNPRIIQLIQLTGQVVSHLQLFRTKDANDAYGRPPRLLRVTVYWHQLVPAPAHCPKPQAAAWTLTSRSLSHPCHHDHSHSCCCRTNSSTCTQLWLLFLPGQYAGTMFIMATCVISQLQFRSFLLLYKQPCLCLVY